jgi:prepilin signal peptidase PulO-like enzyme (type II secretory pathway)
MLVGLLVFILGLCFGSFVTAASHRLPNEQDFVFKRSACPKCGNVLKPVDLVPLFSWLLLRGKCRKCSAKISIRYPLVELICGAGFWLLYQKYDLSVNFYILTALFVVLMIMIVADFETYIMPDSTTIATFALALVFHYYNTADYSDYIMGFVVCLVVGLGLKYGYIWFRKKDALGFGDVKFLPVAGAWIGFTMLPLYFFSAGVMGVIIGIIWKKITGSKEFPFGPALAISMFFIVIFESKITQLIKI